MPFLISTMFITPLFAGPGEEADTAFKKKDPNLIYTTRDYFISIPDDCYSGGLCLSEFSLILTFNVGVDLKQNVKQIGFNSADLDFNSKPQAGKSFVTQKFPKYVPVASQDGWAVTITFYPEASASTPKGVVQKCVFDGVVQQRNIAGKLIFYMAGGTYEISIN